MNGKDKNIIEELAGAWKEKIKESGVEYMKEIRTGWDKRTAY